MLLLLAAALLKPAFTSVDHSKTISVPLPQEVSTLEMDSLATRDAFKLRNSSRLSLSTSFFTRPDLTFADSFARSQKFEATQVPSFEVSLEQPKLWKLGDARIGTGASLGLSTWSAPTQSFYEVPAEFYLRSEMAIGKHLNAVSRMGLRSSLYWTNHSTEFSSVSGWGRGFEASMGLEVPYKLSTASLSAVILREARGKNSDRSIGIRMGWGFLL